jgi:glycosyltransferase involved in cell wall biosynthesis
MSLTVLQLLPRLDMGGVERGTLQVAAGLVERGDRALVMSAAGRLVEPLLASGAEHHDWPIGRKRLSTLALAAPLARFLREHSIDVVHARSRLPAWIAWSAIRRLPRGQRPAFVTGCHGPYTPNGYSAIVCRGERVIAISRTIREYLLNHYPELDPARIRVVPRGVSRTDWPHGHVPDPGWQADWTRQQGTLGERFVVTLAARLTRWKGQQDFIRIIDRLRALRIPVLGLIVGGAERRQQAYALQLAADIAARGLGPHLRLLGPRDDLREIMAVSNVVVSLTRAPEAFGRTTLEALSLGRPVVGYAHGGTREILCDLFPDGLCRIGDEDEVVARLWHYWRNPPTVAARPGYELSAMVAGEIAVYDELRGIKQHLG